MSRRWLIVVVMTLAVAGCADHDVLAGPVPRGLSAVLEAPSMVTAGSSMPLTLVLINSGDDSLALDLPGDLNFDPAIDSLNGHEIWSRSENVVLGGTGSYVVLPPHSETSMPASWGLVMYNGAPAPPGTYLVRARFSLSANDTLFATNSPFRFTITP